MAVQFCGLLFNLINCVSTSTAVVCVEVMVHRNVCNVENLRKHGYPIYILYLSMF